MKAHILTYFLGSCQNEQLEKCQKRNFNHHLSIDNQTFEAAEDLVTRKISHGETTEVAEKPEKWRNYCLSPL